MTIEDEFVDSVDRIFQELKTTRSAFTRQALQESIHRFNATRLEAQHRRGYKVHPVNKGEFNVWANEQKWGDE